MERHTFPHQNSYPDGAEDSSPNFQALSLTEVDPVETPAVEGNQSIEGLPSGLGLFGGFSIGILIVLAVRKTIRSKRVDDRVPHIEHSRSSSCSQCGYFNRSPYLKCAVHPLVVQKIAADECPDFHINDRTRN